MVWMAAPSQVLQAALKTMLPVWRNSTVLAERFCYEYVLDFDQI